MIRILFVIILSVFVVGVSHIAVSSIMDNSTDEPLTLQQFKRSTTDKSLDESPVHQQIKQPTFTLELLSPSPLHVGRLVDDASLVLNAPTAVHTTTIGSNTYAVVTSRYDDGIQIIDITNPEVPIPVSSLIDDSTLVLGDPLAVHTTTIGSNTYAVVASRYDHGIQIIDITNPETPIPVSSLIDDSTLVLHDSSAVHTTTIGSNTYAVVTSQVDHGIQIIDITNPETPIPVSSFIDYSTFDFDDPDIIHTTTIDSNTYALVVNYLNDRIQIIDITNPEVPILVSSLINDSILIPRGIADVHTTTIGSNTYAIVTGKTDDGIQIIDITNPEVPIPVSSLTGYSKSYFGHPETVHTTTIGSNTYAVVVSYADDGIHIIDITNPATPVLVSSGTDNSIFEINGSKTVHTTTIGSNIYALVANYRNDSIEIIRLTQTIPVNNSPTSVDDYTTIPKNQISVINVLENDSDVDGDPLKIVSVNSTGTLGDVAIVQIQSDAVNDIITFTPLDNFEGKTTFTYTVSDGRNNSTSSVHITVSPQKDKNRDQPTLISNFDAIVELDQRVYSWTDKVHITIISPAHNLNSNIVDEIGDSLYNPIKVYTKNHTLDRYKLVETGVNTSIFTGQVTLTGFEYDVDGDQSTGDSNGSDTNPRTGNSNGQNSMGLGPTNGFLETIRNDMVTVSFELSENKTVIDSAPIQWNFAQIQWLKDDCLMHAGSGNQVLRIIDPDMNLNPERPDVFSADVWSDTDSGGADATMRETGNATGIFEGYIVCHVFDFDHGYSIRSSVGDTIVARHEDHTLPYPQLLSDVLRLKDTTLVKKSTAPPERAPIDDDLGIMSGPDDPINKVTSGKYAPLPVDDYITISKNQITIIDVFENNFDGNSEILKNVSVNSTNTLGDVAIVKIPSYSTNDLIAFAPLANFEGNTTFTYTVSDRYSSSTSFVYVTVSPQKDKNDHQSTPISNFDSIIKLDQKAYSWTDKVHITIIAPSHNLNSDMIDEIGDSLHNPIKVSTRDHTLDNYRLVETGVNTGIFTGQVLLTGFEYNVDPKKLPGNSNGYHTNPRTGSFLDQNSFGDDLTYGLLENNHNDIVTVSFELSENKTMVSSAPIQWNIGTIEWLKSIHPNTVLPVLRIVDPDMDLNPTYANEFDITVWSDSDTRGIDLTVTETGDATGVFETSVSFTILDDDDNDDHKLLISASDTVTAQYKDYTLPHPQKPFSALLMTATTPIEAIIIPLEEVPDDNLETRNNLDNSLNNVTEMIPLFIWEYECHSRNI